MKRIDTKYGGFASLVIILVITSASVIIGSGVAKVAFITQKNIQTSVRSLQSYYAAAAGIEDAVYRLQNGQTLTTYTIPIEYSQINVTVTTSGTARIVDSQGQNQNDIKKLQANLAVSTSNVQFFFGMQTGQGGFDMQNDSKIIGNVYTSGNITGKDNAQITEDAFAASTAQIIGMPTIGENAQAHAISNSRIGGDARATTSITSSTISKNAYADRITGSTVTQDASYCTSQSGNTVGGSIFQSCPPPANLPIQPFPISDSQISQWESAAQAGGEHNTPCPYTIGGSTSVSIGPLKINCDVTVQNNAIVTVSGTIWIVGDLWLKDNAMVRLSSNYGNTSGIIIVDNPANRTTSSRITVQNDAQILGSGVSGSYLMLISQNNAAETGQNDIAIEPKNDTVASIYYAPHGRIRIQNNTALKEASAYIIEMKNDATLTYESGLANVNFSSGPGGSFAILNWKEI